MAEIIDMKNKFKHMHMLNHVRRIIIDQGYGDYVRAETYPDERTDTGLGVAIVTSDGTSKLLDVREFDMGKVYPHLV